MLFGISWAKSAPDDNSPPVPAENLWLVKNGHGRNRLEYFFLVVHIALFNMKQGKTVLSSTQRLIALVTESVVKGTGDDFSWSGTPVNHFQKQGKIHINQKKQQNPHEIAEIMKKEDFLATFILGGTLSSIFLISNILVLSYEGYLKEKK